METRQNIVVWLRRGERPELGAVEAADTAGSAAVEKGAGQKQSSQHCMESPLFFGQMVTAGA